MGAELFYENVRTDEQTDTRKLIAAFRNFPKASKNETLLSYVFGILVK